MRGNDSLKPNLHILTCGHVDTGKSTTFGHILVELGAIGHTELESAILDAETLGRQAGKSMSSFRFAFTLDVNPDERRRGLTISLKRRSFETRNFRFTLLDGPGHSDFMRNMITGASIADVAILFTSAKEGEFETSVRSPEESNSKLPGQTREHCQLCRIFGVEQMIVAVNKMDRVDWSRVRFEHISNSMAKLTEDVGFSSSDVQVIPVSGLLGDNLTSRSVNMRWYEGPNLIEALDKLRVPRTALADSLPLRVPIQNVVRISGIGHVALGRVETGVLHVGDVAEVDPGGTKGYVRSIEMWNRKLDEAWPGDGVGINVRGANPTFLKAGAIICDPEHPARIVRPNDVFTAEVIVFNHPSVIRRNYSPLLFAHTARVPCRIIRLRTRLDKNTMNPAEEGPELLRNGDVGLVDVSPLQPIALERFSDFPQLGRFALRDGSRTVAAGRISSICGRSQLPEQKVLMKSR